MTVARNPIKTLAHNATTSIGANLLNIDYSLKTCAVVAWFAFCTISGFPALADDSLYRDLGGKDGITKIVEHELAYHLANPQIKDQFDDISLDHLKGQLVIFVCQVSGGPCVYTGHNMSIVHKGMHLTEADFNALVEDMQLAMDEVGIPYRTQNRLLARLAPYEHDVVTK
jgi:hemoglobin